MNGENLLDYRMSNVEPLFTGTITDPTFKLLWRLSMAGSLIYLYGGLYNKYEGEEKLPIFGNSKLFTNLAPDRVYRGWSVLRLAFFLF